MPVVRVAGRRAFIDPSQRTVKVAEPELLQDFGLIRPGRFLLAAVAGINSFRQTLLRVMQISFWRAMMRTIGCRHRRASLGVGDVLHDAWKRSPLALGNV